MVADPDKRRAGISEKALARYEKPWAMFVNRVSTTLLRACGGFEADICLARSFIKNVI